jgi:hypothetical protein
MHCICNGHRRIAFNKRRDGPAASRHNGMRRLGYVRTIRPPRCLRQALSILRMFPTFDSEGKTALAVTTLDGGLL